MVQLKRPDFFTSTRWREQQRRADWSGVYIDPLTGEAPLRVFFDAFQNDLRRRGIPMFAHTVCRSPAVQAELQAFGHSKAPPGRSPHQFGMAVYVVHSVHAWELDRHAWQIVGHIGREVAERLGVAIRWGGDWNDNGSVVLDDRAETLWDPAHWELTGWKSLAGLTS